jgi:hypothetical protein
MGGQRRAPTQVYLLWHVLGVEGGDDNAKLLGVYSTEERAKERITRSAEQPGFRDTPEGFEIVEYEVDLDEWREGYEHRDGVDLPAWFRPYG